MARYRLRSCLRRLGSCAVAARQQRLNAARATRWRQHRMRTRGVATWRAWRAQRIRSRLMAEEADVFVRSRVRYTQTHTRTRTHSPYALAYFCFYFLQGLRAALQIWRERSARLAIRRCARARARQHRTQWVLCSHLQAWHATSRMIVTNRQRWN